MYDNRIGSTRLIRISPKEVETGSRAEKTVFKKKAAHATEVNGVDCVVQSDNQKYDAIDASKVSARAVLHERDPTFAQVADTPHDEKKLKLAKVLLQNLRVSKQAKLTFGGKVSGRGLISGAGLPIYERLLQKDLKEGWKPPPDKPSGLCGSRKSQGVQGRQEKRLQKRAADPSMLDGQISPTALPEDPLSQDAQSAAVDGAKKDLHDFLAAAAHALGSKLKDSIDSQDDSGSANRVVKQSHTNDSVSIDDMLKAYEQTLNDKELKRLAKLSPYQQIAKANQRHISELTNELGNFFIRGGRSKLEGHFRSGIYDLKKAISSDFRRQATGRYDPKVFMRRSEPTERSAAIVFCIDTSASMEGERNAAARETLVLFLESLAELKISHGAITFARTVSVIKELNKDFDETQREALLPLISADGSNTNDYAALQAAAQMMEGSTAKQRIIIFLSDGEGTEAQHDAVRKIEEEQGIKASRIEKAVAGADAIFGAISSAVEKIEECLTGCNELDLQIRVSAVKGRIEGAKSTIRRMRKHAQGYRT